MNLSFLKDLGLAISKHFIKHGPTYVKITISVGVGTAIGVTACHFAYKEFIKKERKRIAEELSKEFAKKVKELEEQYKHNEYILKKKINELCDEFGIEHCYK